MTMTQRRGQGRLKNEFLFYLSHLVCFSLSKLETEYGTQRKIQNLNFEIIRRGSRSQNNGELTILQLSAQ